MSIAMDIIKLQLASEQGASIDNKLRLRDYLNYYQETLIRIEPINFTYRGSLWLEKLDTICLNSYVDRANIISNNVVHVLQLKCSQYRVGLEILRCLHQSSINTVRDALEAYPRTNIIIVPFKDLVNSDLLLEKGADVLLKLKVQELEYVSESNVLRIDVGFTRKNES